MSIEFLCAFCTKRRAPQKATFVTEKPCLAQYAEMHAFRVSCFYWPSPGRFALQLTILTLSATTACPPFSILKETFLMRKVHTSSQKRYVSREPCRDGNGAHFVSLGLIFLGLHATVFSLVALLNHIMQAPTVYFSVVLTLNVRRALTFSCKTSAIARSKFARIFMASCGSMRWSVIRSSRVSVRVAPRLLGQSS